MTKGASVPDRALAVPAEPSSTVSALTGFDPSRERFTPSSYDNKPRHMDKADRRLLDSFFAPMVERLVGWTDDDLLDFIAVCRRVSPINCAWSDFAIAELLHDVAVAIAMEARQGRDGATRLDPKDDSAARKGSPK